MTDHVNKTAKTVAATTTSAATAYGPDGVGNAVWIYNSGSVAVHVRSGDSDVIATTDSNVIPPGEHRHLFRSQTDTHLAIRTASSTATVYFHGTTKQGD